MAWGGRREEGSGWGTHVCLRWIHFDIRQNQYNIVKFKNKIKLKKKSKVKSIVFTPIELKMLLKKSFSFEGEDQIWLGGGTV